MGFVKVTDVRVRYTRATGEIHLIIDWLNGQQDLGLVPGPERVAAMLALLHSGRDCYWNDTDKSLATDPQLPGVLTALPTSASNTGIVAAWEVRIPQSGEVEFLLMINDPAATLATAVSGNGAAAWGIMKVKPDFAPLMINILSCRYRHYQNGIIRNAHPTFVS